MQTAGGQQAEAANAAQLDSECTSLLQQGHTHALHITPPTCLGRWKKMASCLSPADRKHCGWQGRGDTGKQLGTTTQLLEGCRRHHSCCARAARGSSLEATPLLLHCIDAHTSSTELPCTGAIAACAAHCLCPLQQACCGWTAAAAPASQRWLHGEKQQGEMAAAPWPDRRRRPCAPQRPRPRGRWHPPSPGRSRRAGSTATLACGNGNQLCWVR